MHIQSTINLIQCTFEFKPAIAWQSSADNIIKTYFHGQSTKFSWAKYKIFIGKHKFQLPKPHVFVLSTCFHCQNALRFGKHIFMGKVRHFHGQAQSFHGQTELRAPTMLVLF